jgi:uncharacterized membrane protein
MNEGAIAVGEKCHAGDDRGIPPFKKRRLGRLARRTLEFVFAIALVVFAFSRPTTKAGLFYFVGSVVVMLLCLLLLRKWRST